MCIFISLEIITKSSVQFSHSVVSDSLQPHGLQHARPPCPSPTPRVYSNSCPLSRWCHSTTSSSVIPFSSHLQSFPASGSFQMSQFFTLGSQRIGVSAPYLRTAETSVDYAKAFDCVDHSKLWKILKEIGILDHLTFFLRIYAEYIMRNTGLEEAHAGIKIARRNIITSDIQMTPPLWWKIKNYRASWWKWKRRVKKLV